MRIGLLGDRLTDYAKHEALEPALASAARATGLAVETTWVPSRRLAADLEAEMSACDAFVATPQDSNYCADPETLKAALGHVRRRGACCLAVCGGAHYALQAFADEVGGTALGESIFSRASCEITAPRDSAGGRRYAVDGDRAVELAPDTGLARWFEAPSTRERFQCSWGLGEDARALLAKQGLAVAGTAPDLGPVLFEWPDHPFYVAALFLPQWSDTQPHPLFTALLERSAERRG